MIQLVALDRLALSAINVRVTDKDAFVENLADDIAARGLKQNLVVVPSADEGSFEVIAGGRRLQALQLLASRGDIAANYEVPVLVDDAAQGTETSLAENIQRVAMNPADEFTAFNTIYQQIEGSHTERVEHLCKRFGKSKLFIEQRLRLGQLHPTVLEALRINRITLTQASAFGVTSDQDRQLAVWESLEFEAQQNNWLQSADRIRQTLTEGAIKSTDRLAVFVGRQAYEAAGGTFERDLFSDDQSEVWRDGEIVRSIATASLAELAKIKQAEDGWQEVRFTLDSSPHWQEVEDLDNFYARGEIKLSKKQESAIKKLEKEANVLEDDLEDSEDEFVDGRWMPKDPELRKKAERVIEIEAEIEAINDAATVWPWADEHGRFIRYLVVNSSGEVEYNDRWFSTQPVDYQGKLKTETKSDGTAKAESPLQAAGLSQSHADRMACERRDVLAAVLTQNIGLAYEYGVFALVDRALRSNGYAWYSEAHSTLEVGRSEDPYRYPSGHKPQSAAGDELAEFENNLNWSWFGVRDENGQAKAEGDVIERFESFRQLSQREKDQWFAWTVARSLKAANAIDRQIPIHDHLASVMNINVADWWRPDVDNYWGKISATTMEAQLKEAGALAPDASVKLKKGEFGAEAERVFSGEKPLNACFVVDEQVRNWTPPAMRFNSPVTKAS